MTNATSNIVDPMRNVKKIIAVNSQPRNALSRETSNTHRPQLVSHKKTINIVLHPQGVKQASVTPAAAIFDCSIVELSFIGIKQIENAMVLIKSVRGIRTHTQTDIPRKGSSRRSLKQRNTTEVTSKIAYKIMKRQSSRSVQPQKLANLVQQFPSSCSGFIPCTCRLGGPCSTPTFFGLCRYICADFLGMILRIHENGFWRNRLITWNPRFVVSSVLHLINWFSEPSLLVAVQFRY
jgi:hypothetical protein